MSYRKLVTLPSNYKFTFTAETCRCGDWVVEKAGSLCYFGVKLPLIKDVRWVAVR